MDNCLINLTLTQREDFGSYISAMCRSWAYDVPSEDLSSSGIRFFVETEQVFVVSVPEEDIGKRDSESDGDDFP